MNINKVYTLVQAFPITDSVHCGLNGRVFGIRRNPDTDHLHFIDAVSGESLVETTSFSQDTWNDDGTRTITTSSGTRYWIIPIPKLLPTQITEPVESKDHGGLTGIFKEIAHQVIASAKEE